MVTGLAVRLAIASSSRAIILTPRSLLRNAEVWTRAKVMPSCCASGTSALKAAVSSRCVALTAVAVALLAADRTQAELIGR
jgi:hypothetical protein